MDCVNGGTDYQYCGYGCGTVVNTRHRNALGHTGNGGWKEIASWQTVIANPTGCASETAGIQLINNTYNAYLAPYGLSGSAAFTGSAVWTSGNPYNNYAATCSNEKYYATFSGNVFHKADGTKSKQFNAWNWIAANGCTLYQRTCERCGACY